MKMLNILVIHGYVQSASLVQRNTLPLATALKDIATLNYVDGPAVLNNGETPGFMAGGGSRPWWVLDFGKLEMEDTGRWPTVVKWWSDHLSQNSYDGIIGLSQGSAMTALLLGMLQDPSNVPGFEPQLKQDIKFAILSSGFVSHYSPHSNLYSLPAIPTLHTADLNDGIVPVARTVELQKKFTTMSEIRYHREGHSIPVRGTWPNDMKEWIEKAVSKE